MWSTHAHFTVCVCPLAAMRTFLTVGKRANEKWLANAERQAEKTLFLKSGSVFERKAGDDDELAS